MWPTKINWNQLRFGVEIEFTGGRPEEVELLPGWVMALDERQLDDTGAESGSELKPPPLRWDQRDEIGIMLKRLRKQGAAANWSCGLHVHVGLEPWGQAIVQPLVETAIAAQAALQALLQTSEHRLMYCPPVGAEMLAKYMEEPANRETLRYFGRPQSHRCGINAAAWFDCNTVEIRYANGSLDEDEVLRTVELCLRLVAAVGEGRELAGSDPIRLAQLLGAPLGGYPPSTPEPQWHKERMWLENALLPVLGPLALEASRIPNGELHHILPVEEGFLVAVEDDDGALHRFIFQLGASGWSFLRKVER